MIINIVIYLMRNFQSFYFLEIIFREPFESMFQKVVLSITLFFFKVKITIFYNYDFLNPYCYLKKILKLTPEIKVVLPMEHTFFLY